MFKKTMLMLVAISMIAFINQAIRAQEVDVAVTETVYDSPEKPCETCPEGAPAPDCLPCAPVYQEINSCLPACNPCPPCGTGYVSPCYPKCCFKKRCYQRMGCWAKNCCPCPSWGGWNPCDAPCATPCPAPCAPCNPCMTLCDDGCNPCVTCAPAGCHGRHHMKKMARRTARWGW